jgi:hypothetical protein
MRSISILARFLHTMSLLPLRTSIFYRMGLQVEFVIRLLGGNMPTWLRSILAVIGSLAAAVVVVFVVDLVNSLLFMPAGVDMNDPQAMQALAASLPAGAFVILIVGWFAASFAGGWVAARIGSHAPHIHGMVFTVLFLIVGIVNLASLPHPAWVWVLGIAAYIGGGTLGTIVASEGRIAAAA